MRRTGRVVAMRRVRRPWWRWRWRWPLARLGVEVQAAVFWFLAFATIAGGYALLAPAVDDWRATRLPMTRDCRVQGVVDGDTVNLACAGKATIRARIVGYDAPELFSARCPAERAAAERARQALELWVWHATTTEVALLGRDRYGRRLVDMRLSGQRVAAGMVRGGHGRRYFGRLRGGWC